MKYLALISAFLLLLTAPQQQKRIPAYEQYIDDYSALAVEEMHRSGVPASITLAQGLLESGAGSSTLAVKGNNHFGIKCHKDWQGKTMSHSDDRPDECFRVYDKAADSFRDHSDFLRYYDRYKFLFDYPTADYKAWAYGLKKAGYATAPGYADSLIKIIEDYDLSRFDTDNQAEIPQAPLIIETPKKVKAQSAEQIETVTVSFNRLYELNGVHFVYSIQDETYESIAREFGLSKRSLLAFNDLDRDRELLPGTVVYVDRKRSKAEKGLEKYVATGEGESLYDISQRFAVRLKDLCRLNGDKEKDYVPAKEETILLR